MINVTAQALLNEPHSVPPDGDPPASDAKDDNKPDPKPLLLTPEEIDMFVKEYGKRSNNDLTSTIPTTEETRQIAYSFLPEAEVKNRSKKEIITAMSTVPYMVKFLEKKPNSFKLQKENFKDEYDAFVLEYA
jgi:hypothetical protein